MRALALLAIVVTGCYPGVDNGDCAIRCGSEGQCPSNLSCSGGFCVDAGQVCIDPALVLAYSFDDADDEEVPDDSGNANVGGISGGPMKVAGVHGDAFAFDGDGDGLITRHSPSLAVAAGGAFTVSFWIDVTPQPQFAGDQIIIAKVVDNDTVTPPFYEFGIEFDNAEQLLELFLGTDQGEFIVAGKVTPVQGQFGHVAFTWNGTDAIGYLDGVPQDFQPAQSLDVTIPDRGQNLVIGRQATEAEYFKGSLDDIRLYKRALTRDEIVLDMNSSVVP